MKKYTSPKFIIKLLSLFILTGAMMLHTSWNAAAQPTTTLQIGRDNTSTIYAPLNTCDDYSYAQMIYTKNEILAADNPNIARSNKIIKIRFYVVTVPPSNGLNSKNWDIYMGHKTDTSFTSTTGWLAKANMTQVFIDTVVYPQIGSAWMDITLSTPFTWNGVDNIVVAVDENTAKSDCASYWSYTNKTNQVLYHSNKVTNPDPAAPPAGILGYYRPNIQFAFVMVSDNAGLDSLFTTTASFCSGEQELWARVHNYGGNVISKVNIAWSVDGVAQTPVPVTTTLGMENTNEDPYKIISLGKVDFPYNVSRTIKGWTELPNGVADTDKKNDSLTRNLTADRQGVQVAIQPGDTILCSDLSLTLDAGTVPGNPIYIWNNGQLTQSITITEGGVYHVKVQNQSGCFDRDTVSITSLPSPGATSVSIIDNGGGSFSFNVIGAHHVTDYSWDFGDGTPVETGAGPKDHTYAQDGDYDLVLTLANDCTEAVMTREIHVQSKVGIDELAALQNAVSLYPNPATGQFTILNKGDFKIYHLTIYNLLGQKIRDQEISSQSTTVSILGLSPGFYQVLLQTNKGPIVKKLETLKK
jgi:hypothetical protein